MSLGHAVNEDETGGMTYAVSAALRRHRPIFSCMPCYRAKRKCDRTKPVCKRCKRIGQVTLCCYESNVPKHTDLNQRKPGDHRHNKATHSRRRRKDYEPISSSSSEHAEILTFEPTSPVVMQQSDSLIGADLQPMLHLMGPGSSPTVAVSRDCNRTETLLHPSYTPDPAWTYNDIDFGSVTNTIDSMQHGTPYYLTPADPSIEAESSSAKYVSSQDFNQNFLGRLDEFDQGKSQSPRAEYIQASFYKAHLPPASKWPISTLAPLVIPSNVPHTPYLTTATSGSSEIYSSSSLIFSPSPTISDKWIEPSCSDYRK